MNAVLIAGTFSGGEIEPGIFHGTAMGTPPVTHLPNDIGYDPTFEKLVFTVEIVPGTPGRGGGRGCRPV